MAEILVFPRWKRDDVPKVAAWGGRATANRSRIHLYEPTAEERAHRAMDLAAQVGVAVERMQAEMECAVMEARAKRIFEGVVR
ncbi:MAG: hypothetical protein HIU91_06765 [Acidobacteria bacterium]|nr:hypothetical protein [Acidobacteriota bacterium]